MRPFPAGLCAGGFREYPEEYSMSVKTASSLLRHRQNTDSLQLRSFLFSVFWSASVPDPEFHKSTERMRLEGEMPSPINPPVGCRFHTRCPFAREQCEREEPHFEDVGGGHFVSCHKVHWDD